ncbi:MAG: hypothetical protein EA406_04185 [Rhodospirillales bacterium]|nr:MAG: hypothetical protein EA406_04185 [Rhodospirillales bacterium]
MVDRIRRLCTWLLAAACLSVVGAPAALGLERGVVVTPRNFPDHGDADVRGMFDAAQEVGSVAGIVLEWDTPNLQMIADVLVGLARAQGLTPVLVLNPFRDDRGALRVAAPAHAGGTSFSRKSVRDAFVRDAAALAALRAPYLGLGTDVNRMAGSDIREYVHFAEAYKEAAARAKAAAPGTNVFVSFQWEILSMLRTSEPGKLAEHRKLVDVFRPGLDVLAIGTLPSIVRDDPRDLPPDYYARLADFGRDDPKVILQAGWAATGARGAELQRGFAERLPELARRAGVEMMLWAMLHDVADSGPAAGFGLAQRDGTRRPAFAAFAAAAPRAAAPSPSPSQSGERPRRGSNTREADHFSIMVSRLDGSGLNRIAADRDREINHARVSPDHQWVTFTRYNREGPDGTSMEIHGVEETEIMLMRIDGSGMRSLVPPRRGAVAANGYWTPDGRGIIYVAVDPGGRPELRIVDVATGSIRRQPTPDAVMPSDPHIVGDKMVFAAKGAVDTIWISRVDGSEARQITNPPAWRGTAPSGVGPGDYDPKLSPDGESVALMRQVAPDEWHVIVVDLATGTERSLTRPGGVDAVPEWSSDGRLLIFWHVDLRNLGNTGLWTMRPDGSERRQVPLPRGYFYTMPAFFPGDGSGPDARVIFSAKREPKL